MKNKKSNLKAVSKNKQKKTTASTAKKTTGKTVKKTTTKVSTTKKTASKVAKPKAEKNIQKVYRNEKGKVIYRETTDKVGDILVNGAGVKFKIMSERREKPKGYDDGKLKVRVLTVSQGKQKMEILDTDLKYYRDKKVLTREQK